MKKMYNNNDRFCVSTEKLEPNTSKIRKKCLSEIRFLISKAHKTNNSTFSCLQSLIALQFINFISTISGLNFHPCVVSVLFTLKAQRRFYFDKTFLNMCIA